MPGKSRNGEKSTEKINYYKRLMLILYTLLIVAGIGILSSVTFSVTDSVLKTKILQLSAQLNRQMEINLDSYLDRVEKIATLAFAESVNYTYDDTAADSGDYEAVKARDTITENLYNICMMENFVDFGIVYSNNGFVGKISNGSLNAFGNDMYEDLSSMITRPATSDGWATGFDGNYRRIYYVKKIHSNALLVLSFYSSELEDVFEHSKTDGMESLSVKLIEKDDIVIYSSDSSETGLLLDEDIRSRIDASVLTNESRIDDQYLISTSICGDWRVICTMPTDVILAEKRDVQRQLLFISGTVALVMILLMLYIIAKSMSSVKTTVSILDDQAHKDLLTGLLNKLSFENFTKNAISKSAEDGTQSALILLDLDNFKGVNDTLGHTYGDKVLSNVGDILRSVFTDEDLLGRLGGDEFCVFTKISDEGSDIYIRDICRKICKAFEHNYTGDRNDYKISASIGAAMFPDDGKDFAELYRKADTALYCSKHTGKDTFTVYSEDLEGNEK